MSGRRALSVLARRTGILSCSALTRPACVLPASDATLGADGPTAPADDRARGPMGGQPARHLNVHEYQGASLMSKFGVNVPRNQVASTPQEAAEAAKQLAPYSSDGQVVIKSQILAGGRGLGTFQNGFKGGVHIAPPDAIAGIAEKMLGQILVTKQTGPAGKPVNKVLLAEKVAIVNEMYFAILLDRVTAGPMIIACSKGGTSIEDLAEAHPDLIIKVPVNIQQGITDAQVQQVVAGLAPKVVDQEQAAKQVKNLLDMFMASDCTLLEINPLVETEDKRLVAADAKLNFDDNAQFRQKEIFAMRDSTQEDPREVEAAKADLNYIGLSGEIGCMVNGAGLAMATMDIIQLHGSSPANFLDVGGNASEEQVVQAFKILTADSSVKAILVNIFGGIMKCDVIASGIVNAAKQVALSVPLVVRLEGTNVEAGKKILNESGLPIITAEDLDDAAIKAVKAVKG